MTDDISELRNRCELLKQELAELETRHRGVEADKRKELEAARTRFQKVLNELGVFDGVKLVSEKPDTEEPK